MQYGEPLVLGILSWNFCLHYLDFPIDHSHFEYNDWPPCCHCSPTLSLHFRQNSFSCKISFWLVDFGLFLACHCCWRKILLSLVHNFQTLLGPCPKTGAMSQYWTTIFWMSLNLHHLMSLPHLAIRAYDCLTFKRRMTSKLISRCKVFSSSRPSYVRRPSMRYENHL